MNKLISEWKASEAGPESSMLNVLQQECNKTETLNKTQKCTCYKYIKQLK